MRNQIKNQLKLATGENVMVSLKRAEEETGTEFSRTVCKLRQCLMLLIVQPLFIEELWTIISLF